MATSIDDNAADEQSGKSMCQLFIIRCTSLRQEQSISGAEKARKSTCLDGGIPPGRVAVMWKDSGSYRPKNFAV